MIRTLFIAIALIATTANAQWSAGYEARHDEQQYHFDNDSSWDTPYLVPHFFEQRYTADKDFLMIRGRYAALGARWETEFGATPNQTAQGSDFDTFFQRDGDVVTHGGTAKVDMRAFRLSQSVAIATWAGAEWRAAYVFSRDRFDFPPSESSTAHTKPPSFETNWSDTRETTTSDAHELRIGAMWRSARGEQWTIESSVDLSPVVFARLTTELPDKYPGQPIRFSAKSYGASARVAAMWRPTTLGVLVSVDGGLTRPYSKSSSFRRDDFAIGVAFVLGRASQLRR